MDYLKTIPQYLLPHHLVSHVVGRLMNIENPKFKNFIINWFIKKYKVDMSEALIADVNQFTNFNEFFTRELKPGLRNFDPDNNVIDSPIDGFVSQFGSIENGRIFQAKGKDYSLHELLAGSDELASKFADGSFINLYLSPKDYHRVHMPITGKLQDMIYVPGKIFSVAPPIVRTVPRLFARNERVICLFDTEHGPMAVIMVGAIIVAGMHTKWHGLITPNKERGIHKWHYLDSQSDKLDLSKGGEMGHFQLGSTVILLFAERNIQWSSQLAPGGAIRMGERVGEFS